jgi:Tol biopolymer transport system component
MTTNDRFDRSLSAWLLDDAAFRVPDHLDEVLSVTRDTRQRPAWSSLERWLPVDTTFRTRLVAVPSGGRLLAVAALILILVAVAVFAIGSQRRLPEPFGLARNGILISSGDGDIYAVDPVTTSRTAVISGPEFDFGATFSRDGTKFNFLRGSPTDCGKPDCGLILMVADADGSDVRALTPGLPALDWQDWSPDGTRIVIDSVAPSGVGHVMSVVNVDGSGMRTLDVGQPVHELSWLPPNGDEIVYRGERVGSPGIFAVRPDGTGIRPLTRPTTSNNDYQDVAVSPDGALVTYRDDGYPGGFRLHILELKSGKDRILPGLGDQLGAVFSPDGRLVAYLRVAADGTFRLVVAPTDGSSTGIELGPPAPNGSINNYSWSPDGMAILANYDAEKVSRLLPIDGSAPTDLIHADLALPAYQRVAP